jgi:hypothetical protein
MRKILLNSLFMSPAVLGVALMMAPAIAATQKSETQAAQAPALEVNAKSEVALTPVAEVKSLDAKAIKPEAATPAEFSAVKAQPVQIAQAQPEKPATAAPSVNSLDQINQYSREGRAVNGASSGQVTSVSQLSDVRPTDWAFQALQSLVERYGCIAGYPDRTYRGNRAMTRYEFAAGVNACLDRVNELIAAATANLVKKEDLAVLQKLQEEFAAELATLRGRVDALEARTTTLEKQQFSTTTKLAGEAIFAITGANSPDGATPVGGGAQSTNDNNVVFQNRVRLALNTSFTGKDLLVTRIAAGNAIGFNIPEAVPGVAGTRGAEGTQTFNFGNTGGNQAFIDWAAYFFPLNDKTRVYIPAVGGLHYDYAPTNSPALDAADGGTGPLSVFAQRNPIYLIGGGSGAGINFDLSPNLTISAGYLADNSGATPSTVASANNPASGNGLFNGGYSALGQVTFKASDALSVGLTYVNAYRKAAIFDTGNGGVGGVGTFLANRSGFTTGSTAAQVNAYGASVAFKLSPQIVLNGFFSYINANFVDDGFNARDMWTYGLGVAFPDFGKKGNLLGFMAGAEPYVGNPTSVQRAAGVRNDIPLHIEGFYKYQLNDNISITPGLIWVINPGQNDNNDDVIIGTVRTTFTF